MSQYQFITINTSNSVTRLALNRAEKHNAFNAAFINELTQAITTFHHDKKARLLIIDHQGNNFSAGADLQYMKTIGAASLEENKADSHRLFQLFLSLYHCNKPTICLVRGKAYGGANGIIAASDFVIAANDSQFCFSEVSLGLVPATIAPFILSKIPQGIALRLFLRANTFSAQEALQYGLVSQITPNEKMEEVAQQLCDDLLSKAPGAQEATKKLCRSMNSIKVEDFEELTSSVIAQARLSPEGQHGLQSFLNKQNPQWLKRHVL